MQPQNTKDREIVTSRIVSASRERVWKAWTDPKEVVKWWGPNGFTNTIKEMNVKPGGIWRILMHGPDGIDYPNKMVFNSVVKPEYLIYTHSDEEGTNSFNVTVSFVEVGEKTKITMKVVFATKEEYDKVVKEVGAIEGAKQTFDRMEAHIAKMK